jgi:hypothetical protein
MKNGNRYYNQPLWGIFKKTADGQILGYVGSKKSLTCWSCYQFYVLDINDMVYSDFWKGGSKHNNFTNKNYISDLMKYHRALLDPTDQVFISRIRSKKCPIEIVKEHIPVMKYPRPANQVLRFKRK